jgi:hypothetical protein
VSIAVGTLFLYLSFRKDRLGIPCQKAGDRSGMNPEQPCGIGGCPFPPPDHLHNLGLLLSGRLRFPAANASLASSRCNAGLCAFSQHCPFKLGKRPNHLHHHATGWRCRIDRFGQAGLPGPGHRENFTYIAAFVWRPAVISWWKIFGRTVKRRPCACAKKATSAGPLASITPPPRPYKNTFSGPGSPVGRFSGRGCIRTRKI